MASPGRARWRGKRRTTRAPRACSEEFDAPGEAEVGELDDDRSRTFGRRVQSPMVPGKLVEAESWKCVARRKWRRREPVTAPDSEAAVWAVRVLAGDAA